MPGSTMSTFKLATEYNKYEDISCSPHKNCQLDPTPTHLLKNHVEVIHPFHLLDSKSITVAW